MAKVPERRVFVDGVPFLMNEQWMRAHLMSQDIVAPEKITFSRAGRQHESNWQWTQCFLWYPTTREAEQVAEALNGSVLPGWWQRLTAKLATTDPAFQQLGFNHISIGGNKIYVPKMLFMLILKYWRYLVLLEAYWRHIGDSIDIVLLVPFIEAWGWPRPQLLCWATHVGQRQRRQGQTSRGSKDLPWPRTCQETWPNIVGSNSATLGIEYSVLFLLVNFTGIWHSIFHKYWGKEAIGQYLPLWIYGCYCMQGLQWQMLALTQFQSWSAKRWRQQKPKL